MVKIKENKTVEKKKYAGLSKKQILEAQKDKFFGMSKEQIDLWQKKENRKSKQKGYLEAEQNGTLPATMWDNIDEFWKALESLELNGTELPPDASAIISVRRKIKTDIK